MAAVTDFDLQHDGVFTPATFVSPRGRNVPAVLLLHGTASSRDEVGNVFLRLSEALAERGIGSLRIDFAGCGTSTRPQPDLTVESELTDALAAFAWLAEQEQVDADRIAVLGLSQGGTIAAILAGVEDRLAALACWSSGIIPWDDLASPFPAAFADGQETAEVDLGFRTFRFSRDWWDGVRTVAVEDAVSEFTRPVLTVAGTADEAVPPESSVALITAVASRDTTLVEVPGADHVLGALDPADPTSERVIRVTAEWFEARLH